MQFTEFRDLQKTHFATMSDDNLFMVDVDKDLIWQTYLDAYPAGTNQMFRARREYDCSCCRSFTRNFGGVVAVQDGQLVSIWDFEPDDSTFSPVVTALSELITNADIKDVFITKDGAFGNDENYEQMVDRVHTWSHFRIDLPNRLVNKTSKSNADLMGTYRDNRNVMQRSLTELAPDAVTTVLDLISEGTLYRGDEWLGALNKFAELQTTYNDLDDGHDIWCWYMAGRVSGAVAKIRNHSMGVLLQDLTKGVDVSEAVRRYEHIVAPTNYKRPKAVYTARMIANAEATVDAMGLTYALPRRHAEIEDITINNVIWANRSAVRAMSGGAFDMLRNDLVVDPNKYQHVPSVNIADFVADLDVKDFEILLENRHTGNLMSLIAPTYESPTLFKWNNGFGWAYSGNVADSMRQRVKAAGGRVDGYLRYSIQWNTADDNPNDYDAHCVEPNGSHIYFSNTGNSPNCNLDVDIIRPAGVAVENITWGHKRNIQKGVHKFYVHNYAHRGGRSGFTAEIEFNGVIHEFSYNDDIPQGDRVVVAVIEYDPQRGIRFIESLPSTTSSKSVWGLNTNQWQPVSACMYSPNHWDGQGVGNLHYMFMLADCLNDSRPNGFFNEYLDEALTPHRKVFEALGSKMRVDYSDEQLSGLGFSSTQRASFLAKVDGKIIKVVV